jgi:hypothetical protein
MLQIGDASVCPRANTRLRDLLPLAVKAANEAFSTFAVGFESVCQAPDFGLSTALAGMTSNNSLLSSLDHIRVH